MSMTYLLESNHTSWLQPVVLAPSLVQGQASNPYSSIQRMTGHFGVPRLTGGVFWLPKLVC